MELPHIGVHCSHSDCNQLDFLPIKCSLCSKQFCNDHYKYEDHDCPEKYKVDVRVPVCPLCNQPVPSKRGVAPDLAVNEHLENNCQSKVKKSNRRCSYDGCKVKELIAIQCALCNLNFCLRHRHSADHDCKGMAATRREHVLNGSIFKNWRTGSESKNDSKSRTSGNIKQQSSKGHSSNSRMSGSIQVSPPAKAASVTSYSMNESSATLENERPNNTQMSEDEELARAIALSLEDQDRLNAPSSRNDHKSLDCSIS